MAEDNKTKNNSDNASVKRTPTKKKETEKEEIEELILEIKEQSNKEKSKTDISSNNSKKITQAEKDESKKIEKNSSNKEKEVIEPKKEEKEEVSDLKKKRTNKKKKTKKLLKKPINILGLLVGSLFLISMLIIFVIITYLNILPTKYYLPFTLIMILSSFIIGFMLLSLRVKKSIKSVFLFIGTIIMIICFTLSNYAFKTFDFFKTISNVDLSTKEKYYIMVKSDSKYQSLSDINNFYLATFNENTNVYKDAIDKLNKKVEVTLVETKSSLETIEWLLNDEISVILLSNIHKEQYEEEHGSIEDKVKILDTIEVVSKHTETEVVTIKPVSDDVMTIYISGIDTYGNINLRSRSDVNMLATINTKNHEILLTSIPRDYYVQLHGTTGYKDKLTHAGIYGINSSISTIQDFLNIDINYYVRVNFSTLEAVVNSIGGIDVYSDKAFVPHTNKSLYIKQGMVHMDGKTALAFARERFAYAEGDRHRVKNQQDVLKAIINKTTSSPAILTKYTTLLNNISGYFQTNLDMNKISEIVKIQLDEMPSWEIKQYSLDGTGSKQPTYSMGDTLLYVMIPDQETIDTASKYINGMTKGKTFSELGLN